MFSDKKHINKEINAKHNYIYEQANSKHISREINKSLNIAFASLINSFLNIFCHNAIKIIVKIKVIPVILYNYKLTQYLAHYKYMYINNV